MKHRATQIGNGFSQLLNACLPGGWSDESLSSRAWRRSATSRRWELVRACIDGVFEAFGARDHCFDAWTSERLRLQFPPELRDAEPATPHPSYFR